MYPKAFTADNFPVSMQMPENYLCSMSFYVLQEHTVAGDCGKG